MDQKDSLAPADIKKLIALPLFAAMIAVGSYTSIPVGPVPVVMQNFFVLLAGLVLGPSAAGASACLFLLMGVAGLPVFAGATGGIARFAAPSAGFLVSYPFGAWLCGFLSGSGQGAQAEKGAEEIPNKKKPRGLILYGKDLCAVLAAQTLIFAIGLFWLKLRLGLDWPGTLGAGLLPFLPGDIMKTLAAPALAPILRGILQKEGIGTGR
ncbi:MAG: biotin transporter BioY [Spirochaetia bacterium]|jgi:biotin transport system substrate-specific component|nr:biotin transporter BioY [Spirochaetia bacterium]